MHRLTESQISDVTYFQDGGHITIWRKVLPSVECTSSIPWCLFSCICLFVIRKTFMLVVVNLLTKLML